MMMRFFRSDEKFPQMLTQFESSPEFGGASGSDGCRDDEPGGDEDGDKDEEDGDNMWAPPSRSGNSLGKVSLASFPLQFIPGDLSPGIGIPSDKSPGIPRIYRWGRSAEMESSETHEYPSLISTFFDTHTYDGVFAQDNARIQYEEMLRLRDLGANTPSGVPYTKEEILALVRKGKQRGYIPGVGRVLTGKGKTAIFANQPRGTYTDAKIDEMLTSTDKTIDEAKEEAKRTRRELELLRRVVKSDGWMSQLLTQLGSQSEIDGDNRSGSGGGGDDESGEDEDAGGDDDI
ncbi:hypothetical protein Tco_1217142 [Tanacetum coccineum]